MLLQLARDLTNFVYPPFCVCCRSVKDEDRAAFCADCEAELSALSGTTACPRCASPIPAGSACPFCGGAGIHPFGRIAAFAPFREPLRKMIHEVKFHHRWPLAETLAKRMLDQERVRELLDQTDVLIPVPLHWSRQISRGYNQADSLARGLARHRRGLVVAHAIVRLKNTSAQTTVRSVVDRADNLRFAFGLVDPAPIGGKRIALVDDVMTTGATLKAAARAVQQASPAGINAIVLAVADARRRDFQAV
ncbi:MAG: ComF family protein [Tepidisphaeraceae bacterium]